MMVHTSLPLTDTQTKADFRSNTLQSYLILYWMLSYMVVVFYSFTTRWLYTFTTIFSI